MNMRRPPKGGTKAPSRKYYIVIEPPFYTPYTVRRVELKRLLGAR